MSNVGSLEWTLKYAEDLARRIEECDKAGEQGIFEADGRDVALLGAEVTRLRKEIQRLKTHMRNIAGWLNNGCEPAKGAAELLLIAGLPDQLSDNP